MKNHASRAVNPASEKRFRVRRPPAVVAFASVLLLLPSVAWADFAGRPSARVTPNNKVEIRWIGDFIGNGRVDVFDNPDGIGTPIDGLGTEFLALDHRIVRAVGGVIKPDTTNYQVQYPSAGTLCNGAPGRQILEPIRADGSSVFKQKSVVPAKFRVCDANSVSIGTPGLVSNFSIIQVISGTVVADVNEAATSTTPDSAFRWDGNEQQWIFNISTRNLKANATYVNRISLNDGTYIEFRFGLK